MPTILPGQTTLELNVARFNRTDWQPLLDDLAGQRFIFATLRELQQTEPAWLERLAALDNSTRDSTTDPNVPRSVAAMRDRIAELAFDFDACFVASLGGEWVGYTVLDTAHSDGTRLRQSWTGVAPAHRRQGLATALKLLTVRYATEHRYETIVTSTRPDNVASAALNRRMGFRGHSPCASTRNQ